MNLSGGKEIFYEIEWSSVPYLCVFFFLTKRCNKLESGVKWF